MALPENRQAVQELLKELEPLVLGKNHGGTSSCAPAVAEAIVPAGDSYPGQEVSWVLWSVTMKTRSGPNWGCGLSFFVDADELRAMFTRYFGDRSITTPYALSISGADRFYINLPAAVRIQENDSQIRFSFDWGREQQVAQQFHRYSGARRLPSGSEAFGRFVSLLQKLEPEVYRGGPDPELPYESSWLLDYHATLGRAAKIADHIFFQNWGDSSGTATVYTNLDVVFMKHEVE